MKVIMIMKWDGVSLDQYEQVRNMVKWETDQPQGGLFHVATHDGNALRVTDIWDSADEFNHFVMTRLMPATAALGIPGMPNVEMYPVYAIYNPNPASLVV